MRSRAEREFWHHFVRLPRAAQRAAVSTYKLWRVNPRHPSLRFKKVEPDVSSVRVTQDYRALARQDQNGFVWYWIGPHHEYDQLLRRRR